MATPTEADSVKLLTVHRAKGLEWASVFLVGRVRDPLPQPTGRARCGPPRRPCCPRRCAATPRDLPQLDGHDKAALDRYRADTRAHDRTEELRLGYVAFTRAAHRLGVTSYCWSARTTPFGPVGLPGRGP